MLQTIREHTQGWIAGTIISIIILSFALWGIHSYFVGGTANSIVAQVNSVDITKEQLSVAFERLRRQAQTQNHPVTAKDEAALKSRALQTLVEIQVLKQASIDQGFLVSEQQIDNYLQSMPEFQVDGQFSKERFQEILSSTLLSASEFLDLIETSLLIDQPKLGIVFSSFSLPDEANYTISLVNQERDISYLTIPAQYFISQPSSISSQKIQAYYDQHQAEFKTPDQMNVEYLQLSLKELSSRVTPADNVLQSFYNENINSYTNPMEWKIADIEIPVPAAASQEEILEAQKKADAALAAVKAGQDFATVAKQYASGLSGQAWMPLGQVPEALQKTVAGMTKPGQVSDLVKTDKGFVIIKIQDVKVPVIQPFEAVKEKVKEAYVRQHAEEKFAELRDQLADLTYEHPDSLQFAAKTLNLPIQTSELFSKEKGGQDISQFKKVRDTAFSNDVLNVQNNSDVIQLNPETVIVLRVKSHVASTLLPLKSVTQQIEGKLKAEAADNQAKQLAQDLQKKLSNGIDPQVVATEAHLAWNKAGLMGRYSTKMDSAILDLAFRLPDPTSQSKPVYGVTRIPSGYAIVVLNAVKPGAIADQRQYSVFAEQVQNSQGLLEYELYKQSQIKHAKVKMLE